MEVAGQDIVHSAGSAGTVQSPHIDGVERELGFGLGAEVNFVFARAGLVARAIAPKTDIVEVADGFSGDGFSEGGFEGGAAQVGEVAECAGGLVGEGATS